VAPDPAACPNPQRALNQATRHWHTGITCKRAIPACPQRRVYESRVDRFRVHPRRYDSPRQPVRSTPLLKPLEGTSRSYQTYRDLDICLSLSMSGIYDDGHFRHTAYDESGVVSCSTGKPLWSPGGPSLLEPSSGEFKDPRRRGTHGRNV
jgi:hypothetical protein